jgi:hypothetical protein
VPPTNCFSLARIIRFSTRVVVAVFFFGSSVFAHDPSIDAALHISTHRDKTVGELWVPIRGMLLYDGAVAGTYSVPGTYDAPAVAAAHAKMILDHLHFNYDETELKPRLLDTAIRSLHAGISIEETEPQAMAVYSIELAPDQPISAPERITVTHEILRPPEEVTMDQGVLLLIDLRLGGEKKLRTQIIGVDEIAKYDCDWAGLPDLVRKPEPATAPAIAESLPVSPTMVKAPEAPVAEVATREVSITAPENGAKIGNSTETPETPAVASPVQPIAAPDGYPAAPMNVAAAPTNQSSSPAVVAVDLPRGKSPLLVLLAIGLIMVGAVIIFSRRGQSS